MKRLMMTILMLALLLPVSGWSDKGREGGTSGYFNEHLKGKFLFFRFYDDGKVGLQMLNSYTDINKKEVILQ